MFFMLEVCVWGGGWGVGQGWVRVKCPLFLSVWLSSGILLWMNWSPGPKLLLDISNLLPQHSSSPCSSIIRAHPLHVLLPESGLTVLLTFSVSSSSPHLFGFLKYLNSFELRASQNGQQNLNSRIISTMFTDAVDAFGLYWDTSGNLQWLNTDPDSPLI